MAEVKAENGMLNPRVLCISALSEMLVPDCVFRTIQRDTET